MQNFFIYLEKYIIKNFHSILYLNNIATRNFKNKLLLFSSNFKFLLNLFTQKSTARCQLYLLKFWNFEIMKEMTASKIEYA